MQSSKLAAKMRVYILKCGALLSHKWATVSDLSEFIQLPVETKDIARPG